MGPLLRLLFLAMVLLTPRWTWAFVPPPIEGHVTDPARHLSPSDESALEAKLSRFLADTGDHVAVFVAPSLGGETIEDVAHATFNTWGIGAKGKDNGVLLVWAPGERKVRIETGRGVGHLLPDVRASRIIRDVITPRFQAEEYGAGVDRGVDAIFEALRGRPFVPGADVAGEPDRAADAADPVKPMARWKKLAIALAVLAYIVFMLRRASIPGGLGPGGGGGSSSRGGSSGSSSSYSGGGGRSGGGGASGGY